MRSNFSGPKQETDGKLDRWSKDSEAGKLLKAGLENGDIDPNDPPKQVWESSPLFQQYELSKFRAAFNKLKAEMGCLLRNRRSGGDLQGVDENSRPYSAEYATAGGGAGYTSNEEDISDDNAKWTPIHTVFEWSDSSIRKRITVLIVMPSGVNSNYTVAVTGGGSLLEIVVQWPSMLHDWKKLHEPFERVNGTKRTSVVDASSHDYLMKTQAFRAHMLALERRMDRMESKVQIALPRVVHAHDIETNAIGRKDDGTRILYINLLCECTDGTKQQGKEYLVV